MHVRATQALLLMRRLRAGAKYIYVQAIATLPGAEKTTQEQYATTKHCVVSSSGHSEAVSVQML